MCMCVISATCNQAVARLSSRKRAKHAALKHLLKVSNDASHQTQFIALGHMEPRCDPAHFQIARKAHSTDESSSSFSMLLSIDTTSGTNCVTKHQILVNTLRDQCHVLIALVLSLVEFVLVCMCVSVHVRVCFRTRSLAFSLRRMQPVQTRVIEVGRRPRCVCLFVCCIFIPCLPTCSVTRVFALFRPSVLRLPWCCSA